MPRVWSDDILTSLILKLTPTAPISLPRDLGRASHALFLRLLSQHDAALAERLHGEDGPKPFTCSNLFGGKRQGGQVLANPDDALWLRYTGLSAEVSAFLRAPPIALEVELDGAVFRVTATTSDATTDERAGQTTYETLAAPYLLSRERADTRITLRFASPTAFRSRGQNVPLPLPGSVFGSLVDRWNAFSPMALPDEMRRFAEECIALSEFRGRTRMLHGKAGSKQIGFVGTARFVATNKDRYWIGLMNVLADFAFYAGVGYQTTQGMGLVRRLVDDTFKLGQE